MTITGAEKHCDIMQTETKDIISDFRKNTDLYKGGNCMYCRNCGKEIFDGSKFCTHCGASIQSNSTNSADNVEIQRNIKRTDEKKNKTTAGLLAIFLGAFGVHKFYLGYNTQGIIMLVVTIIGILLCLVVIGGFAVLAMSVIALIEGITYLTKTDEAFYETYVLGNKPWF